MSAVTDETEWLRRRCLEVLELIRCRSEEAVECFEMEDWEAGPSIGPVPTWDPPVDEEPEDEDPERCDEEADRYDEDGNPMRRSEDESGAGGGW